MSITLVLLFGVSSVLCTSSSTTSSSSSSPLPCGTPYSSEQIVDLSFSPNEKLVFNAPFDMKFMDHFLINHSSWKRVAYKIKVNMSGNSTILLPKTRGILEGKDMNAKIPIGFAPFEFDEKNFQNDEISIEWVNIPEDAPIDSNEECFEKWFEVPARNGTLKIEYNQ
ncbi:unnamed protein product [Caenorhabditis brenneri]